MIRPAMIVKDKKKNLKYHGCYDQKIGRLKDKRKTWNIMVALIKRLRVGNNKDPPRILCDCLFNFPDKSSNFSLLDKISD